MRVAERGREHGVRERADLGPGGERGACVVEVDLPAREVRKVREHLVQRAVVPVARVRRTECSLLLDLGGLLLGRGLFEGALKASGSIPSSAALQRLQEFPF